jgi:CRISPR-associated protein Csy1
MLTDKAITEFFDGRKTDWLKKNLNASMTDAEVQEKEAECAAVFDLKNWLPNAANRAGQIAISTHPCTFSHPSSRKNKNGYVSSIIASSEQNNDGFLRTGNVGVPADALGNAAALDVYKFLTLEMADGKNLIQHLEQDSVLAINLFTTTINDENSNYQVLKQGFLAMTTASEENITSAKIKQIYFPIMNGSNEADYHQLSILTASGIVFDLRKRLDVIRFGDDVKEARQKRKDNLEHEDYKEIYNLTTIGYGGTKPQNISVLNNQNGGKAHLLLSLPPSLKSRDIHFPYVDFFTQVVRYSHCKNQFQSLHKLYSKKENNMQVSVNRDDYYRSIIDYIIDKMWQVRAVASEQYHEKTNQLPSVQKIWLCTHQEAMRDMTDDWLAAICDSVTQFLFHGYEKTLGNKAIKFSDVERKQIKKIVMQNKEALR